MRRLRSLALVLALFCAVPSGWTLCVGPGGHLVIEPSVPAGELCCVADNVGAGEACVPEGCENCRDLSLESSASLRARVNLEATVLVPAVNFAGDPHATVATANFAGDLLPVRSATPPLHTVSLRC